MADSVSVVVTLERDAAGRMRLTADAPGLVPEGADLETAFMSLGSGMIRLLGDKPVDVPPKRFARQRRAEGVS